MTRLVVNRGAQIARCVSLVVFGAALGAIAVVTGIVVAFPPAFGLLLMFVMCTVDPQGCH